MTDKNSRNPTCDAWGHQMEEVPDDRRYSDLKVWKSQVVFQCRRCPVRRYVGLDALGNFGMSRYWYPESWKRYRADDKPSRAEFRRRYAVGRNRNRRTGR